MDRYTVIVRVEIEAECYADAVSVVDDVLDDGTFQDAINEAGVGDEEDITVVSISVDSSSGQQCPGGKT